MSQESSKWLNTQTLIGYVLKRGKAWHYRSEDQGAESNHYDDAIPVEDVKRRLFDFKVVERQTGWQDRHGNWHTDPSRKSLITSDTMEVLGVFKDGYQIHPYDEWLLDHVATILDQDLGIASAGLLKNRGQAWVQVEMPDNMEAAAGVQFRPNITCATSYDGSLASTYAGTITNVVCDNTLSAALGESGQKIKVRHSRHSNLRIQDARDALGIVFKLADDFKAEVERLTSWKVTEAQFQALLDVQSPLKDASGTPKKGRGLTLAAKKQDALNTLWRQDERVAPWRGTAFGVLQAYNTYNQHMTVIKGGVPRVIRNMENVVSGKSALADMAVMDALAVVCK